MIDATMRDSPTLRERAGASADRPSAATSGNTMSSRRAISEGLVERGLPTRRQT
jgi:hypothetical protein